MNSSSAFADPVKSLLAASGGDTVKIFDVSVDPPGDPCCLSYSPSPGCVINSVKWNHTNLVVASAGEDKKISLWRKSGQCIGTLSSGIGDSGDNTDESFSVINFSNKGSRYLCSGGSGQTVRIWDLQRRRCIKWLKGHTSAITGAVYNCKDEHLASVSVSGDLILHNLTSGSKAAELKDPNQQVLRVLDYARTSRHLLTTSGDDGSIHLYDTTIRNPKMSWVKQHSAPTSGVSFSPSNDKIIASVGLDKKLCIYDVGARRPSLVVAYETPFSSMAFRDDGLILACGTVGGKVVFYDVRGKPQPLMVLKSYGSSEAVNSLCWQIGKPLFVKENCGNEMALLGGSVDDTVVMPDPLPLSGRCLVQPDLIEETPNRNLVRPSGNLARLNPRRTQFSFRDEMDVFSPVVDVQPITPSIWDDKKAPNLLNSKRFSFSDMPIVGIDRNQEDPRPTAPVKIEEPPFTDDKFANLRQSLALPTRVGMTQQASNLFRTKEGPSEVPTTVPRRTYAERIGAVSLTIPDSPSVGVGSPKVKKIGTELKDEISSPFLMRSHAPGTGESGHPFANGGAALLSKTVPAEGPGSSFTLQLFQRTLEEKLDAFQKYVHEDMRNLHIDILRQFHLQEMQFSATTKIILDQQADLIEQIKALRMENSQLRQLL